MCVCVVFLRSKIGYDSGNGSNTAGMLDRLFIYFLVCTQRSLSPIMNTPFECCLLFVLDILSLHQFIEKPKQTPLARQVPSHLHTRLFMWLSPANGLP